MSQRLHDEYFDWMCELINHDEYDENLSYKKLLCYLDNVEFTYILEMDENRAQDGIDLRYRFGYEVGYSRELIEDHLDDRPCSILEMMVALSIRCEEGIMDDPDIGDRTGKWFWDMISSLGLDDMTDSRFDEKRLSRVIHRFLCRAYKPNGEGGLFTLKYHRQDMRDIEIWYQMMWHLDEYLCLE